MGDATKWLEQQREQLGDAIQPVYEPLRRALCAEFEQREAGLCQQSLPAFALKHTRRSREARLDRRDCEINHSSIYGRRAAETK